MCELPGGDEWLHHNLAFQATHLVEIWQEEGDSIYGDLHDEHRRRCVWQRRRTLLLLRALRDTERAHPRAQVARRHTQAHIARRDTKRRKVEQQ